jgi:hypothetical protein
LRWGRVGR